MIVLVRLWRVSFVSKHLKKSKRTDGGVRKQITVATGSRRISSAGCSKRGGLTFMKYISLSVYMAKNRKMSEVVVIAEFDCQLCTSL